jgi:hypothetical protein
MSKYRNLADFELVPVEESGYVRHTCGHTVWWELFPGCSNDFLRGVSRAACPCCGGETGIVQTAVEWPCHVPFAHIGVAHCHRSWQRCEDVEARHRVGLATVDNEKIEKLGPRGRLM